jgi:acetyl esterase/lipase
LRPPDAGANGPPLRRTILRVAVVAMAIGLALAAKTRIVLDRLPGTPDTNARYLIYLHGRAVEEGGRRPTHPTRGVYEYDRILDALAGGGAIVVSEQGPAGTDVDRFAAHVVEQVRTLERGGVPPEHITVAGFSKGGSIAIRTSHLLKDARVNYVFLAACGDGDFTDTDLQVEGRILSIYEATDDIGRSCRELFARGPGAGERAEIEVHVGEQHGAFYRVHRAWLDPLLRWVETAPGRPR